MVMIVIGSLSAGDAEPVTSTTLDTIDLCYDVLNFLLGILVFNVESVSYVVLFNPQQCHNSTFYTK